MSISGWRLIPPTPPHPPQSRDKDPLNKSFHAFSALFKHKWLDISGFYLLPSGGLFFAKPMRDKMYITMMDPFQIKYGNLLSGAMVLPSIMMDILWVAATLLGLGELCFRW